MGHHEQHKELLDLLLRYLRQPSTWQGLTVAAGSLSTYFGVPVEQAAAIGAGILALILILRDDKADKP